MAASSGTGQSFGRLSVGAKIALLIMLLGVISAAYYLALHMPLADELQGAQEQYNQLQTERQNAQNRQAEYFRISEELAAREGIDRRNLRILPADPEIAAFLQDLNRLAELSGLRIQNVEPQPEETDEFYVRIPVNLVLGGSFHQLAKFFYNVSKLERAINLENIKLTAPTVTGDQVMLQASLLATTFRRPPDPNDPNAAGAQAAAGGPQ